MLVWEGPYPLPIPTYVCVCHVVIHMSFPVTYALSSASIRQELFGVTVLIRSTSTN